VRRRLCLALPQKSIRVVTSFVFSLCDFVDRSVCPEKQRRSTKSHEPTRNKILPTQEAGAKAVCENLINKTRRSLSTQRQGFAESRVCWESQGKSYLVDNFLGRRLLFGSSKTFRSLSGTREHAPSGSSSYSAKNYRQSNHGVLARNDFLCGSHCFSGPSDNPWAFSKADQI